MLSCPHRAFGNTGCVVVDQLAAAWLPTIVAESLMVFNLAPVSAGGIELSVMPLLPAASRFCGGIVRQAIKHK
ncbi:hypothetical protein I6I11_00005 [Corynebacterium striatum]|uniref:hypothetical protein n=1 Tax=Corynebacterium striatum TaxID=43770 RepID=UPI00190FD41A|nr:hypothetical protein [Corynebacterium striatum]QQE53106.1 hypothetical protein I6I11_00005 [Corynebacterium striatum]